MKGRSAPPRSPAPTSGAGARQRGAALPLVLLFAALLSTLAASALRATLSGSRAARAFADAVRAQELGRGASEALAFRLATASEADRRGGRFALHLPDATVTVDYLSESARIDANLAPVPLLVALFGALGVDPPEAEAIGSRIELFRRTAAAAARAAPVPPQPATSTPPPSTPAPPTPTQPNSGAPSAPSQPLAIRDVSEIAQAWGVGPDLARRLAPELTVSNGTAQVDPVLADRVILTALLGAEERVSDYVERRQQGFVNQEAATELLSVPARAFVSFAVGRAVRATALVRLRDGFSRRFEMVLAPPPASQASVAALAKSAVPVAVAWHDLP